MTSRITPLIAAALFGATITIALTADPDMAATSTSPARKRKPAP